ncbi:hypothetical protein ACTXT7_003256 [Hymenolepis weldensis]
MQEATHTKNIVGLRKVGSQGHPTVLYSTSDNYSNGFAHPVCTTTRITSHQTGGSGGGGQRHASPGGNAHLSSLVTQPQKCSSAATAAYTEMPTNEDGEGDPNKCDYQFLLQQKVKSSLV